MTSPSPDPVPSDSGASSAGVPKKCPACGTFYSNDLCPRCVVGFAAQPTTQSPPGGCDILTTSCYGFPAATNLAAPSPDITMPTLVSIPFGSFGASVMPAPAQIVGLQWQVNSSGGACTVELRLDDIAFIPAAAPPEPATSDAGDADAADGGT